MEKKNNKLCSGVVGSRRGHTLGTLGSLGAFDFFYFLFDFLCTFTFSAMAIAFL